MTFLRKLVGLDDGPSARSAKERLQLVIVHDRADLSQGRMESLKDEMIEVISRYVKIDRSAVKIALTRDRNEQRLVADIPLQTDRRRN